MRTAALTGYFLMPAIVLMTTGAVRHGFRFPDLNDFLLNYLFLVAPQLLWAVLAKLLKFSSMMMHAGYLGVTAALLSLHLWFEWSGGNRNSLGWLYYWPLALCLMFCAAVVATIWEEHFDNAPNP
jgi:hypothetical protein